MADSSSPIRNVSSLNWKTSCAPKVNRTVDSASHPFGKAIEEGGVVVGTEYVMRQEVVQVYSILLNF